MKVTEHWLREWVNPKQNIKEIDELLSLSGLEVDALHDLPNNDHLIDINLTPNRGDCLSIHGVARELAVLTQTKLMPMISPSVDVTFSDQKIVKLDSIDCLLYSGRIIRNIDNTRPTPAFIQERLEQLGVRTISLIVDIANYVMFEIGQPLHAFDLNKIGQQIIVRDAKLGESLKLLDETIAQLDERTLVIADEKNPLALAGVMGGLESGVTLDTTAIFLESAHFLPQRIAGKTRLFGINSDGAYRFERGVDPALAAIAMERASALILEYAGGQAGPVTLKGELPAEKPPILLRFERIKRLLGMDFPKDQIVPILERLGMKLVAQENTWQVIPPSFRFDITMEADLIEELARVYGYHHIPTHMGALPLNAISVPEEKLTDDKLRALCVARGFNELITYSFVDHAVQELLTGKQGLPLLNPMSSQMDVMRVSLLPGLLQALCYNQNRQQMQMRLFEIGLCFIPEGDKLTQEFYVAGVLSSQQADKHWQIPKRDANFYDIKGDVESLLALTGGAFTWQAGQHPALHPGQSAIILKDNRPKGFAGQLHPHIAKQLGLKGKVFVFEIAREVLLNTKTPRYFELSKFPSIRRDLALIVDKTVAAQDLCSVVAQQSQGLLQDVTIFDVYIGPGIAPDKKSVAMAIILQSPDRTLNEAQINALMQNIINALETTYQATIRN
ncbi:MAG: phenylalanine--tRNA ligase subunit beta [Legionellales bacterium]|jgi:phenylalanyl-tRNA synthetase beta chain